MAWYNVVTVSFYEGVTVVGLCNLIIAVHAFTGVYFDRNPIFL